ncbi:hypothetical protein KI688_011825 [Linnemannia hyalina]|uniref:Uncharacterized protein n=1 Tax=Linnemannia hyalina TaxID=64524 RepID=A0A9P8BU25_9FUNG|nr:hypothetical protein KI688_011825 [Linnemannia hyalina]
MKLQSRGELKKLIERNEQDGWKFTIEDTEDKLLTEPQLVKYTFGQFKIHGHAVTVLDEHFVSKFKNYSVGTGPHFKKAIRPQMQTSTSAPKHGCMFEQSMTIVPLGRWWSKPSGPDMVFIIRIDGTRMVPDSAQLKLHQKSSSFSENNRKDALSTVSAPKIEGHAKNIRKYCQENVYISMIATYPTKRTLNLPALPDATIDSSGMQHVVIHVGDANFGDIFPKELVEFIDKLKNAGERSAGGDDGDGDDRTEKQRG